MKYAEMQKQSVAELQALLAAERDTLRAKRFSVTQKQLKNVRVVRTLKKTIARILTILRRAQTTV